MQNSKVIFKEIQEQNILIRNSVYFYIHLRMTKLFIKIELPNIVKADS